MTGASEALARGRAAYARHAWGDAFAAFREADAAEPLGVEDLDQLAMAAHLLGRDDDATGIGARAFRAALDAGQEQSAARTAFWTGFKHMQRGEFAAGGAWFERAGALVEQLGGDVVEAGYLHIPQGLQALESSRPDEGLAHFTEVLRIGDRFGDPDLRTLGRLGSGQARIALGEVATGLRLLDQAMLAVTSDEASAVVAGIVYCATIEACHHQLDLRRAQEWTVALTEWCERQPDLVPYRGQCRLYRAELMRIHGDWRNAGEETRRAEALLIGPPPDPAVGEAHYLQAELDRLRGSLPAAERGYTDGSRFGRRPEPGLALLRVAQGKVDAARGMLRRALEETPRDARVLAACVEAALAAGDLDEAREDADRLGRVAEDSAQDVVRAIAAEADGTVRLAEGDAPGALRRLREAWTGWQAVGAVYDGARVRVAIAAACDALGDADTAAMERSAAREVFAALDARPMLELLASAGPEASASAGHPHGLSAREVEVLGLVAGGRTNREIAAELGISERTVDRHVSNVYTKLDVSTRAAATAWAIGHGLGS